MMAASWPRDDPRATRLLHIDPQDGAFADRRIGDLSTLLRKDDLLVVNDAATLPASLLGVSESGAAVEARLAGEQEDGSWRAVLFGGGDWRTRTEDRSPPPSMREGDAIWFDGIRADVASIDEASPRLVSLAFDKRGAALWRALYRAGRPVQYAYVAKPLALWHVQTAYAARPCAAEAPSAGFALTWEVMLDLRRRGTGVARVTHAAGLSSTGDRALDARLPFPERYEVSEDTVRAIGTTRERGGRVVAVGTTATRALESAALRGGGRLVAGTGLAELLLGPTTRRNVVDAILTGVHEADTSHFTALEAFAGRGFLERAHAFAEVRGYRGHEFGDSILILNNDRGS